MQKSCEEHKSWVPITRRLFFSFFHPISLRWRMLAEPTVVIISHYLWIKPLCCTPSTYIIMYVSYFSIKLEKMNRSHSCVEKIAVKLHYDRCSSSLMLFAWLNMESCLYGSDENGQRHSPLFFLKSSFWSQHKNTHREVFGNEMNSELSCDDSFEPVSPEFHGKEAIRWLNSLCDYVHV